MAVPLPQPPLGTPYIDPKTGQVAWVWANYLQALTTALIVDAAPRDAQYWVSTANADLTNERNIGALTTGYVKATVAIGIATPSSVARIPLVDGGTNADLSATGGANQVLQQTTVGGNVSVGQLTTANISGLAASTYTPTLTGVANVAASTAFACQYLRVGSVVTVSGKLDVDPTAGATQTQLGISLPVASNFGAAEQCGGTAFAPTPTYSGGIYADAANDRAQLDFTTVVDAANRSWTFSFTYLIV